jgi:hypothetical protein
MDRNKFTIELIKRADVGGITGMKNFTTNIFKKSNDIELCFNWTEEDYTGLSYALYRFNNQLFWIKTVFGSSYCCDEWQKSESPGDYNDALEKQELIERVLDNIEFIDDKGSLYSEYDPPDFKKELEGWMSHHDEFDYYTTQEKYESYINDRKLEVENRKLELENRNKSMGIKPGSTLMSLVAYGSQDLFLRKDKSSS